MSAGGETFVGRMLARFGPRVRCQECGGTLFRGLCWVSRGQVKLLGADTALVHVDFETTSRLGFRHVERSVCRAVSGHDAADDPG